MYRNRNFDRFYYRNWLKFETENTLADFGWMLRVAVGSVHKMLVMYNYVRIIVNFHEKGYTEMESPFIQLYII